MQTVGSLSTNVVELISISDILAASWVCRWQLCTDSSYRLNLKCLMYDIQSLEYLNLQEEEGYTSSSHLVLI